MRAHTNTGKHTQGNSLYFECGGHLAFILPAPSSVSRISGGSLIGDLLCRSQSSVWRGEGRVGPTLFPSLLQSKHPHTGSSNPTSPWGLYYILPLSQLSIPAAAHICPGGFSFPLFTFLLMHADVKCYFIWHQYDNLYKCFPEISFLSRNFFVSLC